MAYSSRCLGGVLVLVLISCSWMGRPVNAVSCTQALEYLMPCQPYLLGVADISASCCIGAQTLAQATTSPADLKSVCQCLKQAATSFGVNPAKAQQLPQLCKINVPIAINPNVNCDAIPLNGALFKLNRYKNYLEMKANPPTKPGPSPGIGH